MALPLIPTPPTVPSRTQDPATFNTNIAAFLAFFATLTAAINEFSVELPDEVDDQIQAAIAAYDPDGAYSKVEIDEILANYRAMSTARSATM